MERFSLTLNDLQDGSSCWAVGLRVALLILALVSSGAMAQTAAETPRTIRVVMDNAYAPYSFQSDAVLFREVSEGFAAIEPAELKRINEKWFGRTINRIGQYLTYAGYAVAAALLIITGLTVWNRTLGKKLLRRTAALSESEQRFRRLVELMPVAVYVCDTEGRIQSYNNRAVELWGREPEQGNTAQRYCASLRLYSPEGKLVPHDESKMAEVLRTGVPAHDLEVVIERPDESRITVLVNIAPLRNGNGELVGAMNCFHDITERKRFVLELDERLRFETLLTELSAAFASLPTTRVDGEIDKWLQNLVEFLDLDRAIFDQVGEDGMTLSSSHSYTARGIDTFPLDVANDQTPWLTEQLFQGNTVKWSRIPDDIPDQAWKEKEFAGRIGAKSVLSIPFCIGGPLICAISFTSIRVSRDWPDEMVARLHLIGEIFANAIARKRTEETLFQRQAELNEAHRLARIGSWEWNILAGARTFSDEFCSIYGFKGEGRSLPESVFSEAIYPDDRERRKAAIDAALKGGPPYDVEFRIIRPDNSVRFVHSRGKLIYDDAGKPVRMVGMAQDITERKQAEDALQKANRQLMVASRRRVKVQEEERRHLARELHDEIGQALTAAKINLQAAIKESDGAKSKRIDDTTAIIERLLGQVRQISLDLRPSTLDDLGLVPALRSLLDQQGRRASVAARLSAKNMPENLDPEIQITCFRIAQEAITNAVRHANPTRVDVDLGGENGNLHLQVHDNGRGFDVKSVQKHAVGLGLLGIKERAALVGGQARIKSSPDKGTTVEVSLPLPTRSSKE